MDINSTILVGIRHTACVYGFDPGDIETFLTRKQGFEERQRDAIFIIGRMMESHGKENLLHHVVRLAEVEHGIRELQPWVRDHVVHALLSFLVGVFLNERLLKPGGHSVNPFEWKLAGLLHDVGYPLQVAKDIYRPFTDVMNDIRKDLSVDTPEVVPRLDPSGLAELANGVDSFELIQKQLEAWRLGVNAREEYDQVVSAGDVCHGMVSSLSVLKVVDMLYQKHNPAREYRDVFEPRGVSWNQAYFEGHVVPACAAVFVHNLPDCCFRSAPLDRNHATLPFLLRLSDVLQDWDRPSASNPAGFPNDAYAIEASSGRLTFSVADPDRRSKIEEEIASSLVATDIDVAGA